MGRVPLPIVAFVFGLAIEAASLGIVWSYDLMSYCPPFSPSLGSILSSSVGLNAGFDWWSSLPLAYATLMLVSWGLARGRFDTRAIGPVFLGGMIGLTVPTLVLAFAVAYEKAIGMPRCRGEIFPFGFFTLTVGLFFAPLILRLVGLVLGVGVSNAIAQRYAAKA